MEDEKCVERERDGSKVGGGGGTLVSLAIFFCA